jgi:hypothetical protein
MNIVKPFIGMRVIPLGIYYSIDSQVERYHIGPMHYWSKKLFDH